jgi:drug/metabolite transporter (DMT)-like permease
VQWGLLGAFAAAVAYGTGTLLQAVGARAGAPDDLDLGLVRKLLRSAPYILGLTLDAVGFGLVFVALRTLPLFTVQAVVACNLAVTAILAAIAFGARPALPEWAALGAVTAGLALLGISAHHETPKVLSDLDRSLLLIAVGAVGIVAFLMVRLRPQVTNDGWALGALSGLMYGAAGIGARILRTPHPFWRVFTDPALYALALAGVLGVLLYAMALQRGSVTVVTASVVVTETVVPAAVGLTLLGDHPAHNGTPIAATGFALAVLGAVFLSRFGEPSASEPTGYSDLPLGTLPAP